MGKQGRVQGEDHPSPSGSVPVTGPWTTAVLQIFAFPKLVDQLLLLA